MRFVVQRVNEATVSDVESGIKKSIQKGLLCYVGIQADDTEKDIAYGADKLINLRIFPDDDGKMNKSLLDIHGEMLLISQFTLLADARKGRRPSYNKAGDPSIAKIIYEKLCSELESKVPSKFGFFQKHMYIESINDGPVTILIDTKKHF